MMVRGWFCHAARRSLTTVIAAALGSAWVLAGTPAHAAARGLPAACATAGTLVTCSYPASDSGQEQALPLPAGVKSVQVTAIGAAGGTSTFDGPNGSGGEAAQVSGTLAVQPGATLYIEVGGIAGTAVGCVPGDPCLGGWNGGGDAGATGAGGGGASDVRTVSMTQPGTLASRLLVAGGGGGGGQGGSCLVGGVPPGGAGGSAGLTGSGGDGGVAAICGDMTGAVTAAASGGTQSGGGDGGQTAVPGGGNRGGYPGQSGFGGNSPGHTSGGGGGGYWGGGSGADIDSDGADNEFTSGGGGGGGSSLVPAGGTAALTTAAAGVTISFTPPAVRVTDLAIRIAGPRAAVTGSRFTETIVVVNNGPGAALGVTTVAELPRQLAVVAAHPAGGSHTGGSRLSRTDPLLGAGRSVTYSVMLRADRASGARVRVTATVTSVSPDPNPRDNTATMRLSIRPA